MTPDKLEFYLPHDRHGRVTRLVGEKSSNGSFYWGIVVEPSSQRDEGERIFPTLTTDQLRRIGEIAALPPKCGGGK